MKRLLTLLAFCVATLVLSAAEPVAIPVRLDAADLVPGARYTYEVRAYFGFFDPKVGRIDDAMLAEEFVAAQEVLQGSFTAPLSGAPAAVVFHLPPPPPAPAGMMGGIVFKAKLDIAPPPGSSMRPMKKQTIFGGPVTGQSIVPHCFRIRGPIDGRFFHLGVAECTRAVPPMPKVPKK